VTNEEFQSLYRDRYNQLDEDTVIKLYKANASPQLNNVIKGVHAECYSLALLDDSQVVSYQIFYINGVDKLVGESR
jgi:hypothetical protein